MCLLFAVKKRIIKSNASYLLTSSDKVMTRLGAHVQSSRQIKWIVDTLVQNQSIGQKIRTCLNVKINIF